MGQKAGGHSVRNYQDLKDQNTVEALVSIEANCEKADIEEGAEKKLMDWFELGLTFLQPPSVKVGFLLIASATIAASAVGTSITVNGDVTVHDEVPPPREDQSTRKAPPPAPDPGLRKSPPCSEAPGGQACIKCFVPTCRRSSRDASLVIRFSKEYPRVTILGTFTGVRFDIVDSKGFKAHLTVTL